MAGHSKWSKVKRVERRARRETRRALQQAREGNHHRGQDRRRRSGGNARLRSAILSARGQSMPNDNIERAIKRGTGRRRGGARITTRSSMKAMRPGGVAVIVDAATDNKNRTAAEMRRIFTQK